MNSADPAQKTLVAETWVRGWSACPTKGGPGGRGPFIGRPRKDLHNAAKNRTPGFRRGFCLLLCRTQWESWSEDCLST